METIEKLLDECDISSYSVAFNVLQEVKSQCINYGEVKKALNNLSKSLIYKNPYRYSYLFSVIKNLLEEEINNVRLTNSFL